MKFYFFNLYDFIVNRLLTVMGFFCSLSELLIKYIYNKWTCKGIG